MIDFLVANPSLIAGVLASGFAAGLAGGLFGIGGGAVTVPALYVVFQTFGFSDEASLKTAIGTSLGVIIISSLRAVAAHHQAGHVDLAILRGWAPWISLGAAAGGILSRWAPVEVLTFIFVGGALYVAWNRVFASTALKRHRDLTSRWMTVPIGVATGLFSSLMGLGGGAIGVMVMTASGRAMQQAVATSAGFGVAVAVPGVLAFMWSGRQAAALPTGSFGYFNMPAFLAMAMMAAIAAPLGARLAHRINAALLSKSFGAYMMIVAVGLIWDVFGK